MNNSSYFNSIKTYKEHYVQSLRSLEEKYVDGLFKNFLSTQKTLEVGSGDGFYSSKIQSKVGYINSFHLDLSFNLIKKIKGQKICSDYLKNPFKPKSFNQIICLGAVEFIGVNFFTETHSLLKDGGKCIVCIPQKNILGFFYNRFYQKKGISLLFYSPGLEIEIQQKFKIKFNHSFLLNRYLVLEKIN